MPLTPAVGEHAYAGCAARRPLDLAHRHARRDDDERRRARWEPRRRRHARIRPRTVRRRVARGVDHGTPRARPPPTSRSTAAIAAAAGSSPPARETCRRQRRAARRHRRRAAPRPRGAGRATPPSGSTRTCATSGPSHAGRGLAREWCTEPHDEVGTVARAKHGHAEQRVVRRHRVGAGAQARERVGEHGPAGSRRRSGAAVSRRRRRAPTRDEDRTRRPAHSSTTRSTVAASGGRCREPSDTVHGRPSARRCVHRAGPPVAARAAPGTPVRGAPGPAGGPVAAGDGPGRDRRATHVPAPAVVGRPRPRRTTGRHAVEIQLVDRSGPHPVAQLERPVRGAHDAAARPWCASSTAGWKLAPRCPTCTARQPGGRSPWPIPSAKNAAERSSMQDVRDGSGCSAAERQRQRRRTDRARRPQRVRTRTHPLVDERARRCGVGVAGHARSARCERRLGPRVQPVVVVVGTRHRATSRGRRLHHARRRRRTTTSRRPRRPSAPQRSLDLISYSMRRPALLMLTLDRPDIVAPGARRHVAGITDAGGRARARSDEERLAPGDRARRRRPVRRTLARATRCSRRCPRSSPRSRNGAQQPGPASPTGSRAGQGTQPRCGTTSAGSRYQVTLVTGATDEDLHRHRTRRIGTGGSARATAALGDDRARARCAPRAAGHGSLSVIASA